MFIAYYNFILQFLFLMMMMVMTMLAAVDEFNEQN